MITETSFRCSAVGEAWLSDGKSVSEPPLSDSEPMMLRNLKLIQENRVRSAAFAIADVTGGQSRTNGDIARLPTATPVGIAAEHRDTWHQRIEHKPALVTSVVRPINKSF
jgi:hypothetical protein